MGDTARVEFSERRTNTDLKPSSAEALEQHLNRVACWSAEIADTFELDAATKESLRILALSHHRHSVLVDHRAMNRILNDVRIRVKDCSSLQEPANAVLPGFDTGTPQPNRSVDLERIVEVADFLDESFEGEPFFAGETRPSFMVSMALTRLRSIAADELSRLSDTLPIFPPAAATAIRIGLAEEPKIRDVVSAIRLDPALTGHIFQAANSYLSTSAVPVRDIERAVMQIGLNAAQCIMVAASLRPLFNTKPLRAIWNHSLEAANLCEQLAVRCGRFNRNEAFLAGLMHDVGRLLIPQLSKKIQQKYDSLVQNGCPPTQVEQVLFGFTHAEAGAHLLRHWRLPDVIVTAVRDHHRVSRSSSKLAALLYLTEFCCCTDEALPSSVRLASALELCGVDFEEIAFLNSEPHKPTYSLRFAA